MQITLSNICTVVPFKKKKVLMPHMVIVGLTPRAWFRRKSSLENSPKQAKPTGRRPAADQPMQPVSQVRPTACGARVAARGPVFLYLVLFSLFFPCGVNSGSFDMVYGGPWRKRQSTEAINTVSGQLMQLCPSLTRSSSFTYSAWESDGHEHFKEVSDVISAWSVQFAMQSRWSDRHECFWSLTHIGRAISLCLIGGLNH